MGQEEEGPPIQINPEKLLGWFRLVAEKHLDVDAVRLRSPAGIIGSIELYQTEMIMAIQFYRLDQFWSSVATLGAVMLMCSAEHLPDLIITEQEGGADAEEGG